MNIIKFLSLVIFTTLVTGCASDNRVLSVSSFDSNNGKGLVLISFDDRNLFGTSGMSMTVEDEKGDRRRLVNGRHPEKINETSPSEISFSALYTGIITLKSIMKHLTNMIDNSLLSIKFNMFKI